ncbi:hypothetical protein B296_00004911 [Ensete ventricosum]|uniref:Uncharacterized protein n=1 Tax=Ensete ventricosum TaxID=4639 RepID=A0A426ZVX6_ENSVE|nr:hypothetical protein B296_00004911 [Ensete ventricosum]
MLLGREAGSDVSNRGRHDDSKRLLRGVTERKKKSPLPRLEGSGRSPLRTTVLSSEIEVEEEAGRWERMLAALARGSEDAIIGDEVEVGDDGR